MAEFLELARPTEGPCASFDGDCARSETAKDAEKLVTHNPSLEDRLALPIGSVQLKNVLRNINPEDIDGGHGSLHSMPTAENLPKGRESRPSH
jgi:hypothetical protein